MEPLSHTVKFLSCLANVALHALNGKCTVYISFPFEEPRLTLLPFQRKIQYHISMNLDVLLRYRIPTMLSAIETCLNLGFDQIKALKPIQVLRVRTQDHCFQCVTSSKDPYFTHSLNLLQDVLMAFI